MNTFQITLLVASTALPSLVFGQNPVAADRDMQSREPLGRAGLVQVDRGQSLEVAESSFSQIDRERVYWGVFESQTIARGQNYKAVFDAQGFDFIPFLGSEAPRSYPLRLELASVRSGEEILKLDKQAPPTLKGDRIEWERGAVQERVDTAARQVEQSFLVSAFTPGQDLVVHLSVETDLWVSTSGQGLVFQNDLGGVRYSGSVAIDAHGKRVEMPSLWNGAGIEIRVPAEFTARAEGPILVDPFLSTFTIDDFPGATLFNPSVAYDYEADQYLVVMQEGFSGNDVDVFSWFVDGFTGAASNGAYVFNDSGFSDAPSVAYHQQARAFMVLARHLDLVSGPNRILGRTRNSLTMSVGPEFTVETASGSIVGLLSPVVGGDHWTSGASYLCAAWLRWIGGDLQVVRVLLNPDGTPASSVQNLSDPYPFIVHTNLCISKSTGDSGFTSYWQVAWGEASPTNQETYVKTQRVRYDGVLTGPRQTVRTNPTGPLFWNIAVGELLDREASVTTAHAMIAFGYGSGYTTSLWTGLVRETITVNTQQMFNVLNYSIEEHTEVAIGTTNDHWILTWAHDGGKIYSAVAQPFNGRTVFSEGRFQVANVGVEVNDLAICSTASGGGPSVWSDAMIVWSQGGSPSTLEGARVFATQEDAVGAQYCSGWPNSTGEGAFMTAMGTGVASAPLELRTMHMPNNVFGYYLVGTESTFVSMPGGSSGNLCVGGELGRYNRAGEILNSGGGGEMSLTIDPTALPLATGVTPAITGQTYSFQSWYRDTLSGNPASNFSTAVRVKFF